MLSTQEIAQLIQQPKRLGGTEIDQLRQLTDRFPYSQVFAILYLQSLSLAQDVLLENEIQRLAIRIQDRSVLYQLIHNRISEDASTETEQIEQATPSVEISAIQNQKEEEEFLVPTQEVAEEIDLSFELPKVDAKSTVESTAVPIEEQEEEEKPFIEIPVEENTILTSDVIEKAIQPEIEKIDSGETVIKEITPPVKDNIVITTTQLQEDQASIEAEREELERKLQLERAIALQEQQKLERQRLIDQLTIKPKAEVKQAISTPVAEKTEEVISSTDKTPVSTENTASPKSFTSWLKAATSSTSVPTEKAENVEIKQSIEEIDLIPTAVYSLQSEEEKVKEISGEEGNKKKNVDALIEKFIKEDPRITSPKKIVEKPAPERTEMYNPMKKGKESLNDAQLPVSETLAKIFVVQGNFPKAIFAYQQLMLIFPEKKTFFAKQIKELEKKLNTK